MQIHCNHLKNLLFLPLWWPGPDKMGQALFVPCLSFKKKFSLSEFQFLVSGFRQKYNPTTTQPARPSKKISSIEFQFLVSHTHNISPFHQNHCIELQFSLQIVHTLTSNDSSTWLTSAFLSIGTSETSWAEVFLWWEVCQSLYIFDQSHPHTINVSFDPWFSHLKARISRGCLPLWFAPKA